MGELLESVLDGGGWWNNEM